MVLTTQKNVLITFKILISKWWWLGPCASWFTKDQECCKLKSTRHILYDSIYDKSVAYAMLTWLCLLQFDWCSQIREWFCPKWQKCHSEHQTLRTHISEGLGTRLVSNVLCCSWYLHPNSILNLHLKHSCMFDDTNCGTKRAHWRRIQLLPGIIRDR